MFLFKVYATDSFDESLGLDFDNLYNNIWTIGTHAEKELSLDLTTPLRTQYIAIQRSVDGGFMGLFFRLYGIITP